MCQSRKQAWWYKNTKLSFHVRTSWIASLCKDNRMTCLLWWTHVGFVWYHSLALQPFLSWGHLWPWLLRSVHIISHEYKEKEKGTHWNNALFSLYPTSPYEQYLVIKVCQLRCRGAQVFPFCSNSPFYSTVSSFLIHFYKMTPWTSSELIFTSHLMLQCQQHVTVPNKRAWHRQAENHPLAFKHENLKQFAFFSPRLYKDLRPGQLIYMAEVQVVDPDGSIKPQRELRVRYFETSRPIIYPLTPVNDTNKVFTAASWGCGVCFLKRWGTPRGG